MKLITYLCANPSADLDLIKVEILVRDNSIQFNKIIFTAHLYANFERRGEGGRQEGTCNQVYHAN